MDIFEVCFTVFIIVRMSITLAFKIFISKQVVVQFLLNWFGIPYNSAPQKYHSFNCIQIHSLSKAAEETN